MVGWAYQNWTLLFSNIFSLSHFALPNLLTFQANGKYRQQGRNYVVEDGDIIFFKFNAGAGLTDKKKWSTDSQINLYVISF